MTASIIVPVYNRKNFIIQCLNSLLAQTMTDYEIIVIDDGSCDGTKELLKGFADNQRISIIYNEYNSGPSFSRNRGIEKSSGQFIALIDSDCIAKPNWLEEIIHPFSQNPATMITAGGVLSEKPRTYWQLVNQGENFIKSKSGFVKSAVSCNMAIRRDFALQHPFDENFKSTAICEDLDLCLFCNEEKKAIFFTDKALITHHHRSTLRSTLKQQFNWGYYNTYVRIKHRRFPYLNYGTLLLLTALLIRLAGEFLHLSNLAQLSCLLIALYLGLVLYLDIRTKKKNPFEIFISYPGSLIKCLSNCWGNICWLGRRWRY